MSISTDWKAVLEMVGRFNKTNSPIVTLELPIIAKADDVHLCQNVLCWAELLTCHHLHMGTRAYYLPVQNAHFILDMGVLNLLNNNILILRITLLGTLPLFSIWQTTWGPMVNWWSWRISYHPYWIVYIPVGYLTTHILGIIIFW